MNFRSIAAFMMVAAFSVTPAFAAPKPADSMSGSMSGGSMGSNPCPPPARFGGGVYCGAPKLQNTLSLIVAGGGPKSFSTVTLFGVLAGPVAGAEKAKLIKQYGADAFGKYIKTFDFVISDSLKIVTDKKVPLPANAVPSPKNGKALSAALYTDGVDKSGMFSVEYMLDHLVSHPIHVQVMKDIDANADLGPSADGAYHAVTLQIFKDLKAAYKL